MSRNMLEFHQALKMRDVHLSLPNCSKLKEEKRA